MGHKSLLTHNNDTFIFTLPNCVLIANICVAETTGITTHLYGLKIVIDEIQEGEWHEALFPHRFHKYLVSSLSIFL